MARIYQIANALEDTPEQYAVVDAMAHLVLSSYAAQAGSIIGDINDVKRDWLADCETAWDMAQELNLGEREYG